MSPTGVVFDISEGCVDDGPGLRTTVFLKGCALGCPWCHNPEGLGPQPEIGFDLARCIDCGRCAAACPQDRTKSPGPGRVRRGNDWRATCRRCGRCAAACPSGARRLVGRSYSVTELLAELLPDRDYFVGTGGGVTFSGGEPLLQDDFLFAGTEALTAAGVHVAVETAGLWPRRLVPRLTGTVPLVLFDLKHVDPIKLAQTMGRSCTAVLDNLTAILASDVDVELRLTLIPGFNDGADDLQAIGRWLAAGPRQPVVRLQSFHRLATAKAGRFGTTDRYPPGASPSPAALGIAGEILGEHALVTTCDVGCGGPLR